MGREFSFLIHFMPKKKDTDKIRMVGHFHVLFHTLPGGDVVASIVLPSAMESEASASKCAITFSTGHVKPAKGTSFLTDSSVSESTDAEYRLACQRNGEFLHTLSFDRDSLWGLAPALRDALAQMPEGVSKVRLYGGDILCTEMLESLGEAMEREEKFTLYTQTSRVDILNNVDKASLPGNMLVFSRIPNRAKNLCLNSYPYATVSASASHVDLDVYPSDGNTDIEYRLGENNTAILRNRGTWWQEEIK